MENRYIVEDSSFLLSVLNPNDSLHNEAIETLEILSKFSNITLVFPEIVIHETSFTLMRLGVSPELIREKINELSMLRKVIIFDMNPFTSLRYISRYYNELTLAQRKRNITKTNDYLIGCSAIDFHAAVISSDSQMIEALNSFQIECFNFSEAESRKLLKEKFEDIPF